MDDESEQQVRDDKDDEQIGRFCDAFVSDFDGTSALIISALEKDTEPPTVILETLTEILQQVETCLPAETCDHYEMELIPHVVQIALSKSKDASMDAESVECVAEFLESVLLRVAQRLLYCDACLVPTLVHILDEQRSFYENRLSSGTDEDTTEDGGISPLFLRIISHWGALDGFSIFLRCLQATTQAETDGNDDEQVTEVTTIEDDSVSKTVFSFDAIQCIYRVIYAVKDHVSPEFLKRYAGPLAHSSRVYVTSISESELGSVPREMLLELVHIVELIVARASSYCAEEDELDSTIAESEVCVQLLQLDLMLRFFTSSSLEKRIYGLGELTDILNRGATTHINFFVKWIRDNQLVDLLFGEKKHSELIKRALPLLRFLAAAQDVMVDWIDAMWVCFAGKASPVTDESSDVASTHRGGSHTHEIVRVTVHSLLLEVLGFAPVEVQERLMGLIKASSRQIDADMLALLSAIAKRTKALRTSALMYLWEELPLMRSPIADEVIEEIATVIGQSLDDEDDSQESIVEVFAKLCAECIESASRVSISLRLIERLGILVKTRYVHVTASLATRLVPAMLAEMEVFERQFKLISDDIDYSTTDADDHILGVRERLLALRGCMTIAQISLDAPLSVDVFDTVWDLCVSKSSRSDESSSLFFQWIEYCFRTKTCTEAHGGTRRLLNENYAEKLIHRRFGSLKGESMSMSALACFHHLFRKVNISHGGIIVCNDAGAEVDDETEDADSQVLSDLLTGKDIIGDEELWSFALHAADQAVAEEAMTLLARYHMDVVPALAGSSFAYNRKREYVAKCTGLLCSSKGDEDSVGTRAVEDDAHTLQLVGRCLDCLRYFLDANNLVGKSTEAKSTRSDDYDHANVTTSSGSERLTRFALEHLEQKLQLLDVYPSPMKESPYTYGPSNDAGGSSMLSGGLRRPSWNFKQHHAVLEAIVDECDQDVRTSAQEIGESDAIIDGSTRLHTGEDHVALTSIERRLSIDTSIPGPLRPTQLTTSPSVRARPNLHWFQDTDVTTTQEPDFVLESLGTEPTTGESDTTIGESSLSLSQLLVNWPKLFDTLFDFVNWDDEGTTQRAWGLLCQLPINAEVLQRMLKLRPSPNKDVLWAQLLDTDNSHRLLYGLRLVEALLLPCKQKECGNESEDKVRRQWRERFLRLGGVQHIECLLSNFQYRKETTPIENSCIGALARILAYVARLHYAPSDLIDPQSSFDSRLCHSTLSRSFPQRGHQIELLFTLSIKLLCPTKQPCNRSEGTTISIVEMLCSCLPLNPAAAMTAFRERTPNGVRDMLESVFSSLPSNTARREATRLIVDMETSSRTACGEFYEAVIKAALEMSCEGERPEELFKLILALCPYLPAISSWVIECSIISTMLVKLESLVHAGCCSASPSLCNLLQVIGAIASHSGPLQDACLSFQPSNQHSGSPWILDILTRRILWNTGEKTANEPVEAVYDAAVHQVAQDVVLALGFRSGVRSDPNSIFILKQLSSYYDMLLSRLAAMGRPWNIQPSDELQEVSENGIHLAGLVNPGCVCYMNSVVQQLFMMPAFRTGLLMMNFSSSTNEWQHEAAELQKLFVGLASSRRKALDPTEFALSHRDMDGQPTDLNVQMDADEFFCLLLDRVETSDPKSSTSTSSNTDSTATFLDKCFGGVLVNQILTEHGHLSEREEKFFALSLDISQKQHLPESLSLYVQGETLDGDNAYYCEQVKKKVSATKRVCIKKLPQTLVCHLKRFEFDFDTMQKIKIHDYLAFPEEIDMFPYTSEAFATKQSDGSKATSIMYDLVGIIVHSGSSDMGHYYTFIKDRANKSDKWYEFNDQSVKPFDISTMGDECFGGEEVTQKWDHGSRAYVPVVQRKRRSAYMLVYERREALGGGDDPKESLVVNWKSTSTLVQEQRRRVLQENRELQHVVNAATAEHIHFIQKLAALSLTTTHDAVPEDEDRELIEAISSDDDDFNEQILRCVDEDVHVATLSCQRLFGLSSLLQDDEDSTIGTLVHNIEDWLNSCGKSVQTKLLFCKWLLAKATSTSPPNLDNRVFVRRSWLFDVLVFCEKRTTFVQQCCFLLQQSLQFLAKQGRSPQDERVAMDFLRFVCKMFYERHDVVIEDPASGSRFPIPQASIVHAVTVLGTFMKDCIEASSAVKGWFVSKSGFVDRLLFSLQENETTKRCPSSAMAPLTSHTRSCTLNLERQILSDAFTGTMLRATGSDALEDSRLLLSHSVLKNIVAFELTEVLTPLMVHCVRDQMTSAQGERFVTLLLAVLEEVKSTHLDQLLHIFGMLLDAEDQAEHSCGLTSIHEDIFSPSSGLLEAAAYYRDHRTLHEYAFLLVEFVVTRASSSPQLQRYFQNDKDIAAQVEWVKHWLGDYLDPNGTIRRSTGDSDDPPIENQEDPTLDKEVRLIFRNTERAFGFAMLQIPTLVDDDDSPFEDKVFAIESLEDSDGLLFSSDGENQDDDEIEDATIELNNVTMKRVTNLDRRPSLDAKSSHHEVKSNESHPETEEEKTSSSSTIVTRAHMSSAA